MKLQSFGISNFKAFGHSLQRMPIKPITLIFGPNSAGKSSLLQSYLWSLHAAESGEFSKPLPGITSGLVDLGGFQSLLHGNDNERRIEIEICLREDEACGPVRIVHQLGLPSRADLAKTEEAWIAESSVTKDYLAQTRIAWDARYRINQLFLFNEASQLEVDAILANDELLQAVIDGAVAYNEEHDSGWSDGDNPTLELFREIAAQGRDAWAEVQKLRPSMEEITLHQERVKARIDAERHALGLLSVEILYGNEVALKATRLPGKKILATQILDPTVVAKLPSPKNSWIEAFAHQAGNRIWKTMFRGYEVEMPNTGEFREIPDGAIQTVFAWLRGSLEESHKCTGQLVYLGPLRHLPRRRELLGVRGEATNDSSLAPWLRLRDEPSVRIEVNRLLNALSSQSCEFAARLMAEPQEVVQTANNFGGIMTTKFDPANPSWFEAEKVIWGSNEEYPDFEQMRDDDQVAAFEKLDETLLVKEGAEVLIDLGIRDKRHGVIVSIRDVGTGISQIAPILVHAVAEEGKVIAIEQPEIHIHPALQAELADVFIQSAVGKNQNTFLLETHSEHLILRILRRIRETSVRDFSDWSEELKKACPDGIRPEDVAVLYVKPSVDGSEIVELPITADGDFSQPWPSGFFTDRDRELF